MRKREGEEREGEMERKREKRKGERDVEEACERREEGREKREERNIVKANEEAFCEKWFEVVYKKKFRGKGSGGRILCKVCMMDEFAVVLL